MSKVPCERPLSCEPNDLRSPSPNALFRRLAAPLLVGLLLSSCGSAEERPDDRAGTKHIESRTAALDALGINCIEGRWRPMSALALAQPVDYVALYRQETFNVLNLEDAAGKPCVTAKKPRICEAEIRRTVLQRSGQALLTTRGDTVRTFGSLTEVLDLLGTIDTPDEALLMLHAAGIEILCTGGLAPSVEAHGNGFHVTVPSRSCASASQTYVVSRAGAVTETTLDSPGGDCRPAVGTAIVAPGSNTPIGGSFVPAGQ